MKFLSDENFRLDVLHFLEDQGHDVKRAPKGSSDKNVALLANKEKRILLTNDSDFANTLSFLPRNFYGILVFRIHPPRYEKFIRALEEFLAFHDAKQIKGKTFIIDGVSILEIE